ncbi:MAG: sigma-70 family RNA polymerase sigma factor [Proteobacteria bacterium]|nr:sigma-70 family RNA polymerase sigma factor [Pseudomonadota bacterium]
MASEDANRAKLRRVFDAHYDAVSRYCHRRLPAGDANDAAAQVFVVAWKKIEAMPAGEAALPWLYGVARYEVSSARRSARRLLSLRAKLGGQARTTEDGPEVVVVRNSEHEELLAALGTLRPADQEVLRLRVYEELSLAEIAAVLGCSVEAAKKRSARALRRLRRAAGMDQAPAIGTESPAGETRGQR